MLTREARISLSFTVMEDGMGGRGWEGGDGGGDSSARLRNTFSSSRVEQGIWGAHT